MGFNVTALAQKARTKTIIVDSDLDMGQYDVIATDVKGDTAEFSEFVGGVGNFTSGLFSGGVDVSGILHAEGNTQVDGNIILEGSINNVNIADDGAITTSKSVTATGGFVGSLQGNVNGNVTGALTGNVNGNVTGRVTSTYTVTFSDQLVTISGGASSYAGDGGIMLLPPMPTISYSCPSAISIKIAQASTTYNIGAGTITIYTYNGSSWGIHTSRSTGSSATTLSVSFPTSTKGVFINVSGGSNYKATCSLPNVT